MTSPDGSNLFPVIASEGVPPGQIYFMQPDNPLPTSPILAWDGSRHGPMIFDEAFNLGSIPGSPWVPYTDEPAAGQPEHRNPETAVLDDIDALVDEQMAGGEPRTGYDYDDPQYPKCPHCRLDWHGLKITHRMQQMRALGSYDESYRYADDDSEILCPGSNYEGNWTPPLHPSTSPYLPVGAAPAERAQIMFDTAREVFAALGFHPTMPPDPFGGDDD